MITLYIETNFSDRFFSLNKHLGDGVLERLKPNECNTLTNPFGKYSHYTFLTYIYVYNNKINFRANINHKQKMNFIPSKLINIDREIISSTFLGIRQAMSSKQFINSSYKFKNFINIVSTINFINKIQNDVKNKARCLIESKNNSIFLPIYDMFLKSKHKKLKVIYKTNTNINIYNKKIKELGFYYDLKQLVQFINEFIKINPLYYNMIYYTNENLWMIQ